MTFSYSLSGNARDGLRLLCGDTRASQALLQDEEYDFITGLWPDQTNNYLLASYCAEAIAGKFAREIDFSADSQSLSASALQQKYTDLAVRLRALAASSYVGEIWVGGLDFFEVGDPTVTPPSFGTGMHDSIEAGIQDYGDYNGGRPRDLNS